MELNSTLLTLDMVFKIPCASNNAWPPFVWAMIWPRFLPVLTIYMIVIIRTKLYRTKRAGRPSTNRHGYVIHRSKQSGFGGLGPDSYRSVRLRRRCCCRGSCRLATSLCWGSARLLLSMEKQSYPLHEPYSEQAELVPIRDVDGFRK